jgi:hypothetical protein
MEYPWWTGPRATWGFDEENRIRCMNCAEKDEYVLGRELTDAEIDQAGGVECESCGRRWRPSTEKASNGDPGTSVAS